MQKLSGKVVEVHSKALGRSDPALGDRLRSLRELAGLSRAELCKKLEISPEALLALESEADVSIPVLKSYIEALGATLEVCAKFSPDSAASIRILNALDLDPVDENQLVLPIIGEDLFRPARDVVLSIKPQYSNQILNGSKTVELRRRFPINVPSGTLAYIYSTTPDRALVGLAEIDAVEKQAVGEIWRDYKESACISKKDFDTYFSGQEHGFALKLKQAIRFSQPIGLADLRERFAFEPPQSFVYAKPVFREALRHELSELPH